MPINRSRTQRRPWRLWPEFSTLLSITLPNSDHQACQLHTYVFRRFFTSIMLLGVFLDPSQAVLINFENCLPQSILQAQGSEFRLQWIPLFVSAVFNSSAPTHNLNVTVYGNVTGQTNVGQLPPSNSSQWSNTSESTGKLPDLDPTTNLFSTLEASFNVLTYTPYSAPPSRFCNSTFNTQCPVPPVFLNR